MTLGQFLNLTPLERRRYKLEHPNWERELGLIDDGMLGSEVSMPSRQRVPYDVHQRAAREFRQWGQSRLDAAVRRQLEEDAARPAHIAVHPSMIDALPLPEDLRVQLREGIRRTADAQLVASNRRLGLGGPGIAGDDRLEGNELPINPIFAIGQYHSSLGFRTTATSSGEFRVSREPTPPKPPAVLKTAYKRRIKFD